MCSASQPSSCAITEAIRSAKHFFPSRALPPYPEPNDQISRASGKWAMYFVSLHGQGTSSAPSTSGIPTECRQGTNSPSLPRTSSAPWPMRVMILMDTATYGESVSCTPTWAIGEPERPHRERDDVHRAPAHRAPEQLGERLAHLLRVAPVVRGPGVALAGRADERPALDAGDVARVGAGEVRVRPLGVGEPLEGPGLHELPAEAVVLLSRAVAPVNVVRLRQLSSLLDPCEQLLVGGWGGRCLCHLVLVSCSGRAAKPNRRRPYTGPPCGPCCASWRR